MTRSGSTKGASTRAALQAPPAPEAPGASPSLKRASAAPKTAPRRGRKTLRQCLEALLDEPVCDAEAPPESDAATSSCPRILSNREALAASLLNKALAGDVRAAEIIREVVGEKASGATKIDIGARFADMDLEDKLLEAARLRRELERQGCRL